jgi:hypothetical protein
MMKEMGNFIVPAFRIAPTTCSQINQGSDFEIRLQVHRS